MRKERTWYQQGSISRPKKTSLTKFCQDSKRHSILTLYGDELKRDSIPICETRPDNHFNQYIASEIPIYFSENGEPQIRYFSVLDSRPQRFSVESIKRKPTFQLNILDSPIGEEVFKKVLIEFRAALGVSVKIRPQFYNGLSFDTGRPEMLKKPYGQAFLEIPWFQRGAIIELQGHPRLAGIWLVVSDSVLNELDRYGRHLILPLKPSSPDTPPDYKISIKSSGKSVCLTPDLPTLFSLQMTRYFSPHKTEPRVRSRGCYRVHRGEQEMFHWFVWNKGCVRCGELESNIPWPREIGQLESDHVDFFVHAMIDLFESRNNGD